LSISKQPPQRTESPAETATLSTPPFAPATAEPFAVIPEPKQPNPRWHTPADETRPEFQNLVFLLVDDSPDGRYLISKTLLRKFPRATVIECRTAETAFAALAKEMPSLIVTHRTYEFNGIDLLRALRQRAPGVLILMTSGVDRREHALEAGADAFYTYDEWLMVGNHVAQLLAERAQQRKDEQTP
jgi:CheY-like chemotaxis protein